MPPTEALLEVQAWAEFLVWLEDIYLFLHSLILVWVKSIGWAVQVTSRHGLCNRYLLVVPVAGTV